MNWCEECWSYVGDPCLRHGFCGECRLMPSLKTLVLMWWRGLVRGTEGEKSG